MTPNEKHARARKANRIATSIYFGSSPADRLGPLTPSRLSKADAELREDFAKTAGQFVPSPTTWAAVVEQVCIWVNAGRCASPSPCTTCDGDRVTYEPSCHHGSPCPCDPEKVRCPHCAGSGSEPCMACGETARVACPDGFRCFDCAEDYPEVAKAARGAVQPFGKLRLMDSKPEAARRAG